MINGALFLKTNFLLSKALLLAVLVALTLAAVLLGASISSAVNVFLVTKIFPLTTIYASLKSHKSDLNIDILILISLLKFNFLLIDHKLQSIFL